MSRTSFGILGAVAVTAAAFAFSAPVAQAADAGDQPYPPFKIGEGLYYVGSSDYTTYLIVTKSGLMVNDGGDAATGHQVVGNIRALGFDPTQVKVLVNTHQHFDHAAGLAEIKQTAPGAKFYASAADGPIIAGGGRGDPYLKGAKYEYAPVKPDVTLKDGQKVSLGGWTLTAHVTGGHTKGCTTWTMKVTENGKPADVVIVGSPNVNPGYKLVNNTSYPGIAADYARMFEVLKSLPCDYFLGAHGAYFDMEAKYARFSAGARNAFVDPAGYKKFVAQKEQEFRTELTSQQAALKQR